MGPMTVIAMSRTEIDRMSVLQDLTASRIKVTDAALAESDSIPFRHYVHSFRFW
jgi:hypothetical protein